MLTWMITGSNGNLGKRLIADLLDDPENSVVAVVRSQRAKSAVEGINLTADARSRLSAQVLDYTDAEALHDVARGANKAIHLVGILKETKSARYLDAHENSTTALVKALADTQVDHLTYLSIVGSDSRASNSCLASKGRAEDICRAGSVSACVLRVPMVLGEGDYASFALKARASKSVSFTFRATSAEQPIYAGDVVRAIVAAGSHRIDSTLDLGGPEVLSRRELTQRAGAILGVAGRVISLPVGVGHGFAWLLEMLFANPPMTRAMLDVLDHDDAIDPSTALASLEIGALTSLDETLRAVLAE